MNEKRILIVDDEPSVCRILKRGLDNLGRGYQVTTAGNGYEALEYIKSQPFDLIVTDYKMAGLDGLALLEEIKRIQPDVRVVLMTAYGSDEVEARARRLNAYRYLAKPLEMDDFRQMVQEALSDMALSQAGVLVLSDQRYRQAAAILEKLQSDIGAYCILLVNVLGQTIIRQGDAESLPLSEIVTLLGGGIATLTQAGRALDGAKDTINLIYRESSQYHLYGLNVGEDLLMVILIANTEFSSPLGSVWYYARRIVQELRDVLGDTGTENAAAPLDADFSHSLEDELDALFGLEEEAEAQPDSPQPPGPESAPQAPPPPLSTESSAHGDTLLGFDEAVRLGLLPSEWVESPSKGDETR